MLIIEDGNIVEDANSFATVEECIAYCNARNLTITEVEETVEKLLIRAMDYLHSIEQRFQGIREDAEQELCFPRLEVYFYENDVSGAIPKNLKNAQCRLAYDFSQDDLQANGTGKEVIEEGVGALKVVYAPSGNASPQVEPVAALALLKPLFKSGAGSAFIPNVR